MPWETRPNSHLAALFEAQVLVTRLSGMTTSAVVGAVRESDGRVWRLLSSAVAEARAAADYSGVTRVGVDETACKRGQSYVTTLVDLDARRVVAVTPGRDKASTPGASWP
jgi:transposase